MRIVINADDFGLSSETVAATIACFEQGAISCATVMVGGAAAEEAVDYAKAHGDLGIGVHLTFTGDGTERPVSPPEEVPTLVDGDGFLLRTRVLRAKALLGRLSVEEIERETLAQVSALRDRGIAVSHVDSHRHLHKLGPFREALRRALPRVGVGRVRTAQDVYLRRPVTKATFWLGRFWAGRLHGSFATTDHLYMPSSTYDADWHESLLGAIEGLHGATLEIGVHPGPDGWRAAEQRSLLAFAPLALQAGHELVSWNEIGSRAS